MTRAQFALAESDGAFYGRSIELINGELIDKRPKSRPHSIVLAYLNAWLIGAFGFRFVNSETSIDVTPEDNPTSQPEPDLIVLNRESRTIRDANPQPADLRLVIEVADTSLTLDRTAKAKLYARAGIVEYWIADVVSRRIYVHRQPADGAYRAISVYDENDSVASLAAPDHPVVVREVFEG